MNGPAARRSFRGPFADGPPASALDVEAPALRAFRPVDIWRSIVVVVVLSWSVVAALVGRLLRRRSTTVVATACDGLVDGFIRLGPTFVKAGQIIASSGGMFPAVLADAARRCLDEVPPFPSEAVHATIEADLGAPVEVVFASFDDAPLSAASIGQVHACTLRDGRTAVVKVQRPDIREQMATDLRNMHRIAAVIEWTPWGRTSGAKGIISDLHAVTFRELNPALEAFQQDRFRSNIGAFGDNTLITVPEVYWDHCGPRTICMQRVHGIPMDHFDELVARGMDGQSILRRGAKVWAEAAMVHGPFHGDMHAGNVWALDDGRGCYLDFGIMGELSPEWRSVLKDLFYTCAFDLDFTRVARAYRQVGAIPEGMGTDEDLGAFLNMVLGPMLVDGFGSIDVAALVAQSLEMLKAYKASVPQQLALIAKQLLYIDRFTKFLAPDYSVTADPYIVQNIFPAEARAKALELGVELDDTAPGFALGGRGATDPADLAPLAVDDVDAAEGA